MIEQRRNIKDGDLKMIKCNFSKDIIVSTFLLANIQNGTLYYRIIIEKMILNNTPVLVPTINTLPVVNVKNVIMGKQRPYSASGVNYQNKQLEDYRRFLQQINYGVNLVLKTSKKTQQEVRCYLSEYSNSILCLMKNNKEVLMIDIGGADILGFDVKYQVSWNLEDVEYIVLKENGQDFILIFQTQDQKLWFQNNLLLMKSQTPSFTLDDHEQFGKAMSLFKKYQKIYGNCQGISLTDFLLIIQTLNYKDEQKTRFILNLLTNNGQIRVLNIHDFCNYLRLYYCKIGCYGLFKKYCKLAPTFSPFAPTLDLLKPVMTKNEFRTFLINQQKESEQEIQNILNTLGSTALCYYQFCRFIFSRFNYIYRPTRPIAELHYPLNHYYCMSSHNTYLIGNQLTSKSKARRYIEDLEKGYRCLELDVHDSAYGPIINHKLTLTSSILLEDIVKAIAKFSNSTTHTPIILSLEIHCKPMGRCEMANIMIKYFGDKILLTQKQWKQFPKLSKLNNKIILKGNLTIDDILYNPVNCQNSGVQCITALYKAPNEIQVDSCIVYISMSSGDFESKARSKKNDMLNISSKAWFRIYPNGTNFFSGNFNPITGLENGVQIIAINSQNNDIWKLLFHAFFQQNQNFSPGYFLKPYCLIEGSPVQSTPMQFVIQVISANNIRFANSMTNYHVKSALFGSQQDNIYSNNFQKFVDITDSTFGQQGVFTNPVPIVYTIRQPCFAFIVLQVSRYGRAAIALKSLRTGFHSVQLLNDQLQPIVHSTLLIKTDIIM